MISISHTSRWNTVRLASLFSENTTKNSSLEYTDAYKFFYGTLVPKDVGALPEYLLDTYSAYTIIRPGDILINGLNLNYDFISQRIAQSKATGIITSSYICLRPSNTINSKYYTYLFKSMDSKKIFHGMGTGIRLTLSWKSLKNLQLPHPSRSEQNKIVLFLDWKASEANKLIRVTQEKILKLIEFKKHLIKKIVTKGLNTEIEMKDSGVPWIGSIPCHWSLSKVKYCIYIENGSDPTTDGDVPVYGSGAESFRTCGEYKNGPTVLLGRKGSTIPRYVIGKYWNVDTAFNTLPKDNILLKYFYYLAVCFDYKYYISQTTIPSMTQSDYENIFIPLPDKNEQLIIITYLDAICAKIDSLLKNSYTKIALLREYKSRLIFDATTGKIDVRNANIPEYEYVEEFFDISHEDAIDTIENEEE